MLTADSNISHYRIISKIGEGGMGEVYLAHDTRLNRKVALKVLPADVVNDRERLHRFEQEARAASALNHPNIVTIHEVGAQNGTHFIATELIEGVTLRRRMEEARVEINDALGIATQIAAALDAAHRNGIVHRDIKPENVMLRDDGLVKVLDFGLAKLTEENGAVPADSQAPTRARVRTVPGMVMGTVAYMSPEQARGGSVDERTDIWSLGVVLYEMVAGSNPFSGETMSDRMASILKTEPPPLSDSAPDELKHVVKKALRKTREERYQTAKELLLDLQNLRRDLEFESRLEHSAAPPTPAPFGAQMTAPVSPTVSTAEVAVAGLGRKKSLIAALAVGLIALAALGVWFIRARQNSFAVVRVQTVTQVTDWPGLDDFPSLSPDGKSVAYCSDHSGSFEIYIKPFTPGAKEFQLTNDGQQNFQPAWSPDGQLVAYHSKARGGIWVIPSSGGGPKQLTDFGTHPAWSPDGKQIAFQSYPLNDLGAGGRIAMPPSTLWTVPSQGGEPKQLTQVGNPAGGHGAPSFSPDGKRLAFEADDYNTSAIWSVSTNGEGVKLISERIPFAYEPVYAPDGKSIIFMAVGRGAQQTPIDPGTGDAAGEPSTIGGDVTLPSNLRRVSFSADGRRMAYNTLTRSESLASVPTRLPTGEAVGASTTLVQKVSARLHQQSFSPDGRRIAFTTCRMGGSGCDIWLADADGGNQTQLTTDENNEMMANWFPNMEEVAYTSNRTGHWTYWAINLNTKRERMLLDLEGDHGYVRLSPDGKQVVFNFKGGGVINVWTASLAGGEPKQITFDKEGMGFPAWSPDGKLIAFQMQRGDDTHIAVIPSEGGTPTQLTSDRGQSWAYGWSPDGDKVLFAGFRGGVWNVYWVSRSTKKQVQLTDYKKLNSFVRYPSWSPLGNQVVYEYSETTGNIWMSELK
jgi:eukaryotic-like serine/threonine-protein kinase